MAFIFDMVVQQLINGLGGIDYQWHWHTFWGPDEKIIN